MFTSTEAIAVDLVWRVEASSGKVASEHASDQYINPASLVKLATTLWAIDRLGPDHRFETRFWADGRTDFASGSLQGTLHVEGGGDPDFHLENVFRVALALRELGVSTVKGDLSVSERFWMGWEHGAAGREPNTDKRCRQMGGRLLTVLDSARWSEETRGAWRRYAEAHSLDRLPEPGVRVAGNVRCRTDFEGQGATALLTHRSRPLVETLRRFNVHSNNDIERLEATLGPPERMAQFFKERWGQEAGAGIEFETTSGLGRNRMTLRQLLRLQGDLSAVLGSHRLTPAAVAPVMNCESSTLTKLFRRLAAGHLVDGFVGKTGTLTTTDRGISALAGWVDTADGPLRFVVAAPGSGHQLWPARQATERWLEQLVATHGHREASGPCPGPSGTSEEGALIRLDAPVSRTLND